MTIPDRTLRQFLAGALEPPDQERVERALSADPDLRSRLALLLATTPAAPLGWVVPPPGAPVRVPLVGAASPAPVMDARSAPDWLVLRLDVPDALLDHRVVVLERAGGVWTVAHPTTPDSWVAARVLPRENGRVRLDLGGGQGSAGLAGRVAVVLVAPPLAGEVAWDLEPEARWAAIRDALADGELPVAAFDVG